MSIIRGLLGISSMLAAAALALAGQGRKAAQRSDIANWNKQVERKKAEKRADKRSKAFR